MKGDIIVNVPPEWNDKEKDELRVLLEKITDKKKYKDLTILITNKTAQVRYISPDVMDKLRGLDSQ